MKKRLLSVTATLCVGVVFSGSLLGDPTHSEGHHTETPQGRPKTSNCTIVGPLAETESDFTFAQVTKGKTNTIVQGYEHLDSADQRALTQLIGFLPKRETVQMNGVVKSTPQALLDYLEFPKAKLRLSASEKMLANLEKAIEIKNLSSLYVEGPILGQINQRLTAYKEQKKILDAYRASHPNSLTEDAIKKILLDLHGPAIYLKNKFPNLQLKTLETDTGLLNEIVEVHKARMKIRGSLSSSVTNQTYLRKILDEDAKVEEGTLSASKAQANLAAILAELDKTGTGAGFNGAVSRMLWESQNFAQKREERNAVVAKNAAKVEQAVILMGNRHFEAAFKGLKTGCQ